MSRLSYWKILTRRKPMPSAFDAGESKLGRVLNSFDLTALGVGATLGVGVYVLAGHVARDQAGPSVILSFLIAAGASFLAGLCYAEFGARVPKSGSAYVYSYCTVGEFIAFIIGWNLLLEYSIGSASVAKGISLYIDSIANDSLKSFFAENFPIGIQGFGEYFDLFSFFVPLLLGVALAFGLRKSTIINNIFTITNVLVVIFVIIAGSFKANFENWNVDPTADPTLAEKYNIGQGGFFPFGFEGTLKGAATCFFGFVGFDCIATTGEEVKNPHKAIPKAILFSLFIIFAAYFGVSTVLTLMWPYYLQDINAPIPHVFQEIGWVWAKWIVTIGGIIGLMSSLFGAMFPLPRIVYAMAEDGLVFRSLGKISERFKTPVTGTLYAALVTGLFGAAFDLQALVNMLSIGTLMAYTVVAISTVMLRFSDVQMGPIIAETVKESSNLLRPGYNVTPKDLCRQVFNLNRSKYPNTISMSVVSILIVLYCLSALGLSLITLYAKELILNVDAVAITWLVIFFLLSVLFLVLISIQPRECVESNFKVPIVPFLPGLSIFVNIYLMLMLDIYTWIRFGIWMLIGLPMYFACACYLYNPKVVITKPKDVAEAITNNSNDSNNSSEHDSIKVIRLNGDITPKPINGNLHEHRKADDNDSLNIASERSLESIEVIAEQALKSPEEAAEEKDNNINQALEFLDTVIKAEEENEQRELQKTEASLLMRQSSDQSIISNSVKNHSVIAQIHREPGTYEEEVEENESETRKSSPIDKKNFLPKDEIELESFEKSSGYHTSEHDTDYHDSLNSLDTITSVSSLDETDLKKKEDLKVLAPKIDFKNSDDIRKAMKAQIDEILAAALAKVEEKQLQSPEFGTVSKKFIDHLNKLMAQPKPNFQNPPMTPQIQKINPTDRNSLRHSKSVPDLTVYGEGDDNDKFDRKESVTSNEIIKIKMRDENSPIPPPPKFDPKLFHSISRQKLKPLTVSNFEGVTLRNKNDLQKSSTDNVNTPTPDSPENEKNLRLSIKDRLEKILSFPPPKLFTLKKVEEAPKPQKVEILEKSPVKEMSDGHMSDDSLEMESLPNIKIEKPFDTVKKQKLLMDNVLKSIKFDPSSDSEDGENLNSLKFNLKHVDNSVVY